MARHLLKTWYTKSSTPDGQALGKKSMPDRGYGNDLYLGEFVCINHTDGFTYVQSPFVESAQGRKAHKRFEDELLKADSSIEEITEEEFNNINEQY